MIELQFAGSEIPNDLEQYGNVFDVRPPRAKLKTPRSQVPEILAALLSKYNIEDVSVQERPLEEVIAEFFAKDKNEPRQPESETVELATE